MKAGLRSNERWMEERMTMRLLSRLVLAMGAIGWCAASGTDVRAAATSETEVHQRIVKEYMEGKFDEVEAELAAIKGKELAALPAGEKADIAYLQRTMAECRPAWWVQIKAGKKMAFQPTVWRPINATYDPAGKTSVAIAYNGSQMLLTLTWDVADMDNPKEAEHGFSKGELNNLSVWGILGMAEAWMVVPMTLQANLDEKGKAMLMRFIDFRANATGVYYGSPRARRWGLWLYCAAYLEKYAKMQTVNSRKAMAAMFVAEVVGHHAKYPSIPWPQELPAEGAEEKMALHLKDWMEKNGWTLAEDKALRDAMKTFALANDKVMGKASLPNGTAVAFDPEQDAENRVKRDAWVKAAFDKGKTN